MKKLRKVVAMLVTIVLVLAGLSVPAQAAVGNWVYVQCSFTWHGGDPAPIDVLINKCNLVHSYDNTGFLYNSNRYNSPTAGDPQLTLLPSTYLGNGEWKIDCLLWYNDTAQYGDPFVGISRSTLDGKLYCDKWASNNVIWQPGQYATYVGDSGYTGYYAGPLYKADFFLTNSESATKTLTVNRSWSNGSPAVDTTLGLYRYYSLTDQYELLNTVTLPAGSSSVTFNTLYSGQYAVLQTMPAHYFSDASATCTGITGQCFQADLTSASSAAVSITTSIEALKTITVGSLTGGTITPNVTQVYTGDTVSLTVTPNTNWRLKAGTLKYTDGTGDHTISGSSFAMPGSDVTISAQFEPKRSVSITALTGGSITPNKTLAFSGDTVSLTVTPDANKQFKTGSLKYTDSGGDHAISGTSFVMPASDITVSAEFEPKQYTIGVAALTGGSIAPDKTKAISGETVSLTITPSSGKQLKPGTLKYTYGSNTVSIAGTNFEMPQANVTISAQFEVPVMISTATLPEGMKGFAYNATVAAQDGSPGYTWSAAGLPAGLHIDADTAEISGTPTASGSFDVALTATDAGGTQAHRTLSLYVNAQCGNGAYIITPDASAAYTAGTDAGGLPTMTVNPGVTGFQDFSVGIQTFHGHAGREVLLFVHTRNDAQLGIGYMKADFDATGNGGAAFNVRPGDVVKVYIVDGLGSGTGSNPIIL